MDGLDAHHGIDADLVTGAYADYMDDRNTPVPDAHGTLRLADEVIKKAAEVRTGTAAAVRQSTEPTT